jgi:PKD repeat protein
MSKATSIAISILILAALMVSIVSAAAPVASFAASERTGLAPFEVQFADTSTQSPTSWLWEFGDGETSAARNPSHTYSSVGTYTVNLTATNADGSNTLSKASHIAVVTKQALASNRFINVYVANDEGVKYERPDGVAAPDGTYAWVPNTYWIMFRQAGGGLNPIHISKTSNSFSGADITRTTDQSGSFWITFSGGQPSMPEGVLLLAVNGTIPDDFRVHIRSTGYEFDPGPPGTGNYGLPSEQYFLDGAVNQTFDKGDFIYGTQSWKPCSSTGYPIYGGEDQADPINQFSLMFIDLNVGALQNSALNNNGMIKVEYSFENLESFAVFNIYGWYSACNHGTGIVMTNNVDLSGYQVVGISGPPVADFTASTTNGYVDHAIQFTDTSTNVPTSWAWNFGDSTANSTEQNPSHTYTSVGTYTVTLTVANARGSDTETKTNYLTIASNVLALPGQANPPTDPDGDGKYEDISGNGAAGFADVVLFFKHIEWIAANEPVVAFDFSGNGGIGFQDIVVLFKELP